MRTPGWCACLLICAATFTPPSAAIAAGPPPLPLPPRLSLADALSRHADPHLQAQMQSRLDRNPAWRRLIRERKMAVGLVDLGRPRAPRFASVNGETMMYAASLPKIAVLMTAFQSFEDGTLKETPRIHDDLVSMIRVSNNHAATRMIDRLGFRRIARVMTEPRYRLYDAAHGGGLWVGKRYSSNDARFPDPLKGLSHAATVDQVCRFYYLLAEGRLVSRERSREMLDILADPGLHHKFVHVLDQRAPRARLYRKSGTWKIWHADSVLVWGEKWRRYILVGLVESSSGEQILRDLVPVAEAALRSPPERMASYQAEDETSR